MSSIKGMFASALLIERQATPAGEPSSFFRGNATGLPPGITDPSQLASMVNDTRGPEVLATVWAFTVVPGIFLGLRMYCRLLKSRHIFWDDIFLFASWLLILVECCCITVSVQMGYGKHGWATPVENIEMLTLLGLISTTFAITAAAWSKTSFALTLLRISGPKVQKFIWFLIISTNALLATGATMFWLNCKPVEKAWRPLMEGTCWDRNIDIKFGSVATSYSGLVDIALALLPWTIILKLQMKTREKIGVALAMSMGVFAGVSAFIKASYLPMFLDPDFPYEGVPLVTWGIIEVGVTIMAASIPVLRVLFRDMVSSRRYHNTPGGTGAGGANEPKSSKGGASSNISRTSRLAPPPLGSSAHCTAGFDAASTKEFGSGIRCTQNIEVDSESFELYSVNGDPFSQKQKVESAQV